MVAVGISKVQFSAFCVPSDPLHACASPGAPQMRASQAALTSTSVLLAMQGKATRAHIHTCRVSGATAHGTSAGVDRMVRNP